MLAERGLTVAVAEEFTGGLMSRALSEAPRSLEFFRGGLVMPQTGVGAEAAGEERALALAEEARRRFGADIGIGIGERHDEETAGATVLARIAVAVDWGDKEACTVQSFGGRPSQLARRTVASVLFALTGVLSGRA